MLGWVMLWSMSSGWSLQTISRRVCRIDCWVSIDLSCVVPCLKFSPQKASGLSPPSLHFVLSITTGR